MFELTQSPAGSFGIRRVSTGTALNLLDLHEIAEFMEWVWGRDGWADVIVFPPQISGNLAVIRSAAQFAEFCQTEKFIPYYESAGPGYRFAVGISCAIKICGQPHGFCSIRERGRSFNQSVISQKSLSALIHSDTFDELNRELNNSHSVVPRAAAVLVDRTFVCIDVSEFSRGSTEDQLMMLRVLHHALTSTFAWLRPSMAYAAKSAEANICTGDGYIYVFEDAWDAAVFAASLASTLENYLAEKGVAPVHFRIGVHTGPVRWFWAVGVNGQGSWNYVGDGINDARRVIEAIGKDKDDVVYLSAECRAAMRQHISENDDEDDGVSYTFNRGRHRDKHKKPHRLYELDHVRWAREKLAAPAHFPPTY
jgi:class 3 adenylate cyclase